MGLQGFMNEHQSLWLFVAGEGLMFVAWVIGGGYYMGKILERFDFALTRLSQVETKTERIDQHGTLYSQYNVKSEVEKITDIVERVTKLEQNARTLAVIAEKVNMISTHITESK